MKSLKLRLTILLCIASFFLACNNGSVPVSDKLHETEEKTNSSLQKNSSSTFPKNVKIIKSAKTRYKVNNVKAHTAMIKNYVAQYRGYISELRFQNDVYRKESQLTIRIPQNAFDRILDTINNDVEFVDYENITAQDVTEKYIDIETRLKTKIELKKRYEEILRKKAKTVKDILDTEDKLGILQEEIESSQGKLNYLRNRVSFSTIQIELYETVNYKETPTVYQKTFWSKSKEGLTKGWNIISLLILGIINIWPIVIIGLVILIILKKKRINKRVN